MTDNKELAEEKRIAEWKIQKDMKQLMEEELYTEYISKVPREYTKEEMETIKKIESEYRNKLMEDFNVWDDEYSKKGELIRKKLILPNLGELIYHSFDYNFLTTRDNEEIYAYNGGYYSPIGEQIIKDQVEQFLEEETKEYYKNEIVGYIRDKNYQERDIFNTPVNLINLQNGVYNIEKDELTKPNPECYFLNKLPVEYNQNAKCPKIMKFIKQVVYKEDIPVIQEFFGYCLYRRYHIHKACMLLGGGRNGKSTTLSLLKAVIGENNVSNQELYQLITNRFAVATLHGKLANICPDISNKALERTGKFKCLCGGDSISAEKKFKDGFNFINYAKLIFSANTLPKSEDNTYAYFSRWILISFPNTFEGKKCNPNILEEITIPEELSGLFNWAIEGLKRLLSQGGFSYGKTVEEVMEQYKTMGDPVYAYCTEFLKCETDKYILKADLWEEYTKWCKKHKLPITPKNILTQELSKHLPELRPGQPGGRGKRKPAYMNIFWKENDENSAKKDENSANLNGFSENPCTAQQEEK